MDNLTKLSKFKIEFNKIANEVLDCVKYGYCTEKCCTKYELYLKIAGLTDDFIADIYREEGFKSWIEIYKAKEKDEYSLPASKAIGRIKGTNSAINLVLDRFINEIEYERNSKIGYKKDQKITG